MTEQIWIWTHPFVFAFSILLLARELMRLSARLHEAEQNKQRDRDDDQADRHEFTAEWSKGSRPWFREVTTRNNPQETKTHEDQDDQGKAK